MSKQFCILPEGSVYVQTTGRITPCCLLNEQEDEWSVEAPKDWDNIELGEGDFIKGTISSPEKLLNGKVAGVQVSQVSGAPYSGTKIRVRGIGSINASSEPLYVVDGYAVGGNASQGQGNGGNGTGGFNPATTGNDIFINQTDIRISF